MPTVEVSFSPLPAHVRTARFVAAAVARRVGVTESLLDEVRLAVSEACSLAVRFHRAHAPGVPVVLSLVDDADTFQVRVSDAVPRSAPDKGLPASRETPAGAAAPEHQLAAALHAEDEIDEADLQAREQIGLAVISGLVDDLVVDYLDSGTAVTMTWPLAPGADASGASGDGASDGLTDADADVQ